MKLFIPLFCLTLLAIGPALATEEKAAQHNNSGFGASFAGQEHPGFEDPPVADMVIMIEPAAGEEQNPQTEKQDDAYNGGQATSAADDAADDQ